MCWLHICDVIFCFSLSPPPSFQIVASYANWTLRFKFEFEHERSIGETLVFLDFNGHQIHVFVISLFSLQGFSISNGLGAYDFPARSSESLQPVNPIFHPRLEPFRAFVISLQRITLNTKQRMHVIEYSYWIVDNLIVLLRKQVIRDANKGIEREREESRESTYSWFQSSPFPSDLIDSMACNVEQPANAHFVLNAQWGKCQDRRDVECLRLARLQGYV